MKPPSALWPSLVLLLFQLLQVQCKPAKTTVFGKQDQVALYACNNEVGQYKWGYGSTSYYALRLKYTPTLGSILHCISNRVGYNTELYNSTIEKIQDLAVEEASLTIPTEYFTLQYLNASKYILESSAINKTRPLYSPVNITKAVSDESASYLNDLYYNFDFGVIMGIILNCYWFGVLIIIGVGNYVKRLGYHRRFHGRVINWVRAKFTIPSLFNAKHTQEHKLLRFYAMLIPTRIETIIQIGFAGVNGLLLGINLNAHHPYRLYKSTYMQILNIYMADRTGMMSFGMIPLLILFAGRNNILTTLTGLPYSSFIVFHKCVSRWMWVHALIHTACWIGYAVQKNYITYYFSLAYWKWGMTATAVGFVMLVLAAKGLRNMSYEVFLVVHIVLAVVFIIGCFYHCYDLGWLEWIYTACAVWFADRVLRIVRMSLFGSQEAEITDVGQDTFKVSVVNKTKWFAPFPGAFAYLYFMTPSLFWQSHPFTIIQSAQDQDRIEIFIKTKAGVTKRIQKRIDKEAVDGVLKLKVCLEGPYGHQAPLDKYSTALIIAGGNGIPGPLSYALHLGQRKAHVKFVWVIRDLGFLEWFGKELELLSQLGVNIDIYVTGGLDLSIKEKVSKSESDSDAKNNSSSHGNDTSSTNSHFDISALLHSPHINFHSSRPNIDDLIKTNLNDPNNGSIGVLTCGAPVMVDDIREAVANHLQECPNRVDLFEELQVW
ncbi:hypothetical protein WICPIJ_001246 [Wickerhamomyces pijperi]|uniref:ferric-chelate reductase (NADPH) n=1 Tax=Wickerhamomyces pijperi TaxID=599730 RepID=A0A9P8TQ36_WICPI|nr:hypothetical protein WICPIJ_001246 [Wickerhamomyces pijperi]